jgi:hypothetical protein
MKADSYKGPTKTRGNRPPRRPPRLTLIIPFDLFAHAQCWVLNQIRERQGRPIKEIAAAAHIGYNTLWEYTQQDHHNTAHTPYAFAQALGYTPERIAQITARWLTKYIHRRQRLLHKGPDYRPKFPWEQKPRQTDPD